MKKIIKTILFGFFLITLVIIWNFFEFKKSKSSIRENQYKYGAYKKTCDFTTSKNSWFFKNVKHWKLKFNYFSFFDCIFLF